MKRTVIKILKYLVFISLGFTLLYFAFRGIDFNSVKEGLRKANYIWVAPALIFSLFAFVSRARRWVLLIQPLGFKPSFRNSFFAMLTGYLANIALPRLGEVTKCVALGNKEKIPVDQLVGTVIVERTIDFISLLLILVLMLFISSDTIGTFFYDNIVYPSGLKIISLFGVTYIFWIIVAASLALLVFAIIKYRKKLASVKLISKIFHYSKGIVEGVKAIFRLERKVEFIFHTAFIWVNYILMTWIIVFCVESTSVLNFSDGVFLLVIGSLAMSAPVQSGIGAFHWIISRGLNVVYGISLEDGLVYAIISHETQLILVTVLGAISFAILLNKQKNNVKK